MLDNFYSFSNQYFTAFISFKQIAEIQSDLSFTIPAVIALGSYCSLVLLFVYFRQKVY